jgi:citrate lyase subunit beta/citryl-CoA lyase
VTWTMPGPAWLFCPADRPERFAKAAAAADVVILDLEDGVGPDHKAAAREALVSTPLDPDRTVVRVNQHDSAEHALDLEALAKTDYRVVMLSKSESVQHVRDLEPREVVVLVESPLGALKVEEMATVPNAVAVMWGAEDLVAAMGGNSSRWADGSYRDFAKQVRTRSLLSAKAFGKLALDSVFLDIADKAGLADESADAVAVGFDAKVAIHPSQVEIIRDSFVPSVDEIDWARRVLEASVGNRGVFAFEGKMVDSPVLLHAERIAARAGGPTG